MTILLLQFRPRTSTVLATIHIARVKPQAAGTASGGVCQRHFRAVERSIPVSKVSAVTSIHCSDNISWHSSSTSSSPAPSHFSQCCWVALRSHNPSFQAKQKLSFSQILSNPFSRRVVGVGLAGRERGHWQHCAVHMYTVKPRCECT